MRILAIDPGDRRVGLAISDELRITAQGLETFDRRTGDFVAFVERLLQEYEIGEIVVGDPVKASGEVGESSEKARALAEKLRKRFGVKVVMWDERFSSAEARRVTRGTRARKGTVDKLAAVIILQSYLDSIDDKS